MNTSKGASYLRWHRVDKPACSRLRLRLEAMLGGACAFCGLTREDGANLEFHHPAGRDWSPRLLSWKQRLYRYKKEIEQGLLVLACDQRGNNCHEQQRSGSARNEAAKLYEYPTDDSQPF